MKEAPDPSSPRGLTERAPPLDERYRWLVEQVTDYAIFLLDAEGRVASWNGGAERIKGYAASEIIGEHFSRFYPEPDKWKCQPELDTARREGHVEDEGWRVRKDGSLFWANVVITSVRDSQGKLFGYAKVTRDLTERHRSEGRLRESEERFRLLVESVKDYAIFMLDPGGHVASWNSGAERIKGYRAAEILGQHFSRFYPADDVRAGKCERELEGAARDGRFEDEGWRLRKDGSAFWANVVLTALRGASGELIGYAKVTRDLTERRAAEMELARLGREAQERVLALTELAEALSGAISLQQVCDAAVEKGTRFVKADTCTVYLADSRDASLLLAAESGCNPQVLAHVRTIEQSHPLYAIGRNLAPAAWVENREQYAALLPELAGTPCDGKRAEAFACLSLAAEGRSVGMLGLGFHAPRTFSAEEREFIGAFARQTAQSIARARNLEAERASAALASRLQESFSATLRSIGDAVIATDAQGAITLMNAVAEDLTGWRERDAVGRPLPEVFHIVNEHTRKVVVNPVEKVLATGGVVGLANHTILLARGGREVPIDDSGAPIRDDGGVIVGVVLVFRDVTERKREESRQAFLAEATGVLSQSLDYEQSLAQVARLAVPVFADWCAVDLVVHGATTPRRLAVAHVDPTKVELARELDAKYPPNPDAPTGVSNVLRTGKSELHAEISDSMLAEACVDDEHLRIARQLGLRSALIVPLISRGHVLGALTCVFAESGRAYTEEDLQIATELARRCANAIDNARLYRSEQQARRAADLANRAKDEFLAVVSHELRTPLNAIMGWSKMLTQMELDERRQRVALETIARNSVTMAQLVEDLLDTSRVISGKLSLQLQKVDILRVAKDALESVKPAAVAKEVTIAAQLDDGAPTIDGDPTRLQQVIWNLLSNAVKFSAKGGRVELSVRATRPSIQIVVSDFGQGISAQFLPHVFEPFRQQDASSTRAHGGLGLGLAICRQIVELHGGQITAASDGEGRGAVFTVTLPISGANALATGRHAALRGSFVPTPELEAPAHLRGLHVLVVDDDDDARQLVASVLEHCGCRVTQEKSVREAMDRLLTQRPDVLLSDIGMPGEDGFDLIRQVRALPRERGRDIPAAAITAYARADDRQRMLNAGYSIQLSKPIEPAELVAVVATLGKFMQR